MSALLTPSQRQTITAEDFFKQIGVSKTEDEPLDALLHPALRCRSVFVSDIHLCSAASRADAFVRFLNHIDTQYLFLVGDIVDCWNMGIDTPAKIGRIFNKKSIRQLNPVVLHKLFQMSIKAFTGKVLNKTFLPQTHLTAIQRILRSIKKGVKTVYIPGNHDDVSNFLLGWVFGDSCAVLPDCVHKTLAGDYYLVTHGDRFDHSVYNHRVMSMWATRMHGKLTHLREKLNRHAFLRPFRFLVSGWLAEKFVHRFGVRSRSQAFDRALYDYLFKMNKEMTPSVIGAILGHTHQAARYDVSRPASASYRIFNTGHWTSGYRHVYGGTDEPNDILNPSCTAVIESLEGELLHVRWSDTKGIEPFHPTIDIPPPPVGGQGSL